MSITPATARRRPILVALAVALLLAAFLAVLVVAGPSRAHVATGDSNNLVAGARTALECIEDGTWTRCAVPPGNDSFSYVFPYALLQYIPAAAGVLVGGTDERILEWLGQLSTLAFVLTIGMALYAFRRNHGARAVAVIAVLASSAVYQSTSAFSEMLSATAVLAAVAAAIERRPWLILLGCLAATIGKETMAPFVLLLVLAVGREGRSWPTRRVWGPALAGVGVGLVLTAGFNVFRFGTPRNALYLDPIFRTPGIARKLEFFAGVWLSPSAGVFWFWPVASAVIVGCTGWVAVSIVRRPKDYATWLPSAVAVLAACGFVAGLAAWLSPFGWIAYGPRLAVPLLPAVTVALLHLHRDAVDRLIAAVTRPLAGLVATIAIVAIAGWPQFGSWATHGDAIGELVKGDATCPSMFETPVQEDAALYYRCTSHVMWRTTPLPLDEAATSGGMLVDSTRGLAAASCGALLVAARRRPARLPEP